MTKPLALIYSQIGSKFLHNLRKESKCCIIIQPISLRRRNACSHLRRAVCLQKSLPAFFSSECGTRLFSLLTSKLQAGFWHHPALLIGYIVLFPYQRVRNKITCLRHLTIPLAFDISHTRQYFL